MSDPVSKEADKVPEDDAWGCPLASPRAHTCIHISIQSNNTSDKDGVIWSLRIGPGRTSSKPAQAFGVIISPASSKEHICLRFLVPLQSQLLLCWKKGAPTRTSTSPYALNLPRRKIHAPVCLSSPSVSTEGLLPHTEKFNHSNGASFFYLKYLHSEDWLLHVRCVTVMAASHGMC